ncbi:MAG: tryptophan--tRNA ligase, partial [Bacteroidota bacterium]|nr:tryptophan--tRNA ligase [Bacteroidota bacterium]
EKELKKVVMSIVTDSKGLEEPKDPETDNVFKLYRLLGSEKQTEELRQNYIKGNFGYGHAKTALLELILDQFKEQRLTYDRLMANTEVLEKELAIGETKANKLANEKLKQVREVVGYN